MLCQACHVEEAHREKPDLYIALIACLFLHMHSMIRGDASICPHGSFLGKDLEIEQAEP